MDEKKYFVSYARADWEFVKGLTVELRKLGADLWIDRVDIAPGRHWDRSVEAALRACPGVILFLSPNSVRSDNVLDEMGIAVNECKHIVPLLIAKCQVPMRLTRLQYIDFTDDFSAAFEECRRRILSAPAEMRAPAAPQHLGTQMRWDSDLLQKLQLRLGAHLGPVAAVVVERAAKQARNADELRATLAASFADHAARTAFDVDAQKILKDTSSGAPLPQAGSPLAATAQAASGACSPETLEKIGGMFLPYMGPLAHHLVARENCQVASKEDLIAKLGAFISDANQRREFLSKAEKI